jgi:hypothetical protein
MMEVSFRKLINAKARAYYLSWSVESANGTEVFDTPYVKNVKISNLSVMTIT